MKVFVFDNGLNLKNYLTALNRIGATVIFSKDVSKSTTADALLLTGGGDVCPYFYGETPLFEKYYDAISDIAEFYLLNAFYKTSRLVLGICKGMQVINVYFGGTIANIDGEILNTHYTFQRDLMHPVSLCKEQFLHKIFNEQTLLVNSQHRQKIGVLANELAVSCLANDGTIEGVEHRNGHVFGVQFHPERYSAEFSNLFYSYFFK